MDGWKAPMKPLNHGETTRLGEETKETGETYYSQGVANVFEG
jgi:hypothetical protein